MNTKKVRKGIKRRQPKRSARGRRIGQIGPHSPLPGSSHTTPAGQIFEDLGFPPSETANLKVRAQLMMALRAMVSELPQSRAAALLGVTQPRVSHLMRGKIGLFTIDTLVNMLAHAGARVRVSVNRRSASVA
ncbi:MAG: helix-turn-helix domain-containing protein [Gemmatimonadaceae bacterium]